MLKPVNRIHGFLLVKKRTRKAGTDVRVLAGGIRGSGCRRRCGFALDALLEFVAADLPERSRVHHEALASGFRQLHAM